MIILRKYMHHADITGMEIEIAKYYGDLVPPKLYNFFALIGELFYCDQFINGVLSSSSEF